MKRVPKIPVRAVVHHGVEGPDGLREPRVRLVREEDVEAAAREGADPGVHVHADHHGGRREHAPQHLARGLVGLVL